jgi:hypothetical protein
MEVIAIIIAFGFLCWALVEVTVHALPAIVAIAIGFLAYHIGVGVVGTIIITLVAGVLTRITGQNAIRRTRSPVVRTTVALLFTAPAAVIGYGMALWLAQLATPSAVWQQIFALSGAVIAGVAALVRASPKTE